MSEGSTERSEASRGDLLDARGEDRLMRIGTWNCRSNIDHKRAALDRLALDVAVIPESTVSPALARESGVTHAWTGDYANKGLGVFAFAPWVIEPIIEPEPLPWCLPVRVRHPDGMQFTLLGIWTVKSRGDRRPSYAKQFAQVIERWGQQIEHEPVIIAGDLNASFQGPSVTAHRRNMEALAKLGAHSSYDLAHGPIAPAEEPATLRWIGKGKVAYYYHCDYVIVSALLRSSLSSVEVGSLADWVECGLSDHCPVLAELDEAVLTRRRMP